MEVNMKTMHGVIAGPNLQPGWLKRIGVGGFLFFLIKGLLWLTVPAVLAMVGIS